MSDSNIQVAIKVRPLIKREKEEKLPIQWTSQGNTIVATDTEIRKRGDGRFEFGKSQTFSKIKFIRAESVSLES